MEFRLAWSEGTTAMNHSLAAALFAMACSLSAPSVWSALRDGSETLSPPRPRTQMDELGMWISHGGKAPADDDRTLGVDLPRGLAFERAQLQLADEALPGQNEIDAGGLQDEGGTVHLAFRAKA